MLRGFLLGNDSLTFIDCAYLIFHYLDSILSVQF